MASRAFRVAYDGRPYFGFQRQSDVPTVEDAIFDALRDLDVLGEDEPKPAGYAAAGRTDADVSAVAQTIALEAPRWLTPAALNAELPADVRAWAAANVESDFHARYDAVWREYTYHLYAPDVDDERARTACTAMVGTHDFRNLTTDRGDTTRTISRATVRRDGEFLVLRIRSPGFLRGQVRRIASLVRSVANGDRPLGFVDRALSAERLDGRDGISRAAAHPLVLTDVSYRAVRFEPDDDARSSVRSIFETRRVEHRTRAHVANTILDGIG